VIEVPLTQGLVALIDDEDWEKVKGRKWYARKSRNTYYAVSNKSITGGRTSLLMHRLVMGLEYGDSQCIDHIDHNGLNNQKSNLEIVTHAQNGRRKAARISKGTSKYRGVTRHNELSKWRARCSSPDGVEKSLGLFDSEEDAARAVDAYRLHTYPDDCTPATLNFPEYAITKVS